MTRNSFICNYINEHPDTWRDDMKDKFKISLKTTGFNDPYVIFNYDIGANFSDPIVQEARGIIIDTNKLEVVCWPFRKFGKYDADYADKIDWNTAVVQEKLDGSIIKLWFSEIYDMWIFSTNSMIFAIEADVRDINGNMTTYFNLIRRAVNYRKIDKDTLDKDMTYIFELVGPDNQVVIRYDISKLYHIGTRNNKTGKEYGAIDIGIETPKRYDLWSLEECIDEVNDINNNICGNFITTCNHEGFVVVDANFNRVKIKSPIYMALHNGVNSTTSRHSIIKMLYNNKIRVTSLSEQYPELAPELKYYDYKVTEILIGLEIFIKRVRYIYESNNNSRKEVALAIKGHPWSSIAFAALDNVLTARQLLESTKYGAIYTIDKLIPKYVNLAYIERTDE